MDKKKLIKLCAYDLFLELDFHLASVNQIVTKAKIAKGTYYLYYQTKEEVYLDILADFYQDWFAYINSILSTNLELNEFLSKVVKSFTKDKKFLELLSQSSLNLEKNISKEIIFNFKISHQKMLLALSKNISKNFQLNELEVCHKLLMTYSCIIGLYQTSKIPPALDLKEKASLKMTTLIFEKEVIHFIELIWKR